MRIALLYPPPWKIPAPGQRPDSSGDGPPKGQKEARLRGDFCTAPYGLLSLSAQAMRAGHHVKTLNLSTFPWTEVEAFLRKLKADVYGLSCFTANRRGVALVATCIRRFHPEAHIVVGGPHISAFPRETLEHYLAVDTVVIGEGERTFMELIGRLEAGESTRGVQGTAWRTDRGIQVGAARERITDLDSLASLHDYFPCFILLTSRGCPRQCTFCASSSLWGRKVSFHSVEYVLDTLEKILQRLPVKTIAIKDDTFTVNRDRVLHICRGIRNRNLNCLWSCDTRADVLDEELLRAMRLAGCQMISLGVESASATILKNIRKNITPATVLEVTDMAKKFGLHVRYYMMAGNRGETAKTFQESLDFIQAARPHEFLFTVLSIYPGTAEFELLQGKEEFISARPGRKGPEILRRTEKLSSRTYFEEDFMELWAFHDTPAGDMDGICRWLMGRPTIQKHHQEGVEECKAVLERLPDLHAAHMDLGVAYIYAGQPDKAEPCVRRSLELDYPVPHIGYNYLACIAAQKGDLAGAEANLQEAMGQAFGDPRIMNNMRTLETWLKDGGPGSGRQLELSMHGKFEIVQDVGQPVQPGSLRR